MGEGGTQGKLAPSLVERAKNVDIIALIRRRVTLTQKSPQIAWGCCPFHKEKSPSFKADNTRHTYHCFGCGADGDPIKWVMEVERLSFVAAVQSLTGDEFAATACAPQPPQQRPSYAPKPLDDREGYKRALKIWEAAKPAKGTQVEAYLRARGIRQMVPDELRYAPSLYHSDVKADLPAMVARLSDGEGFLGIQRTYLHPTLPQKADIEKRWQKKCLANMALGSVRLRPADGTILGLAEGIETALSASQLYSLPVWATLGAARLGKVEIPKNVTNVHIFADSKPAEREMALRAADAWSDRGLHSEVIFPAAHFQTDEADDFNNVLQSGARFS